MVQSILFFILNMFLIYSEVFSLQVSDVHLFMKNTTIVVIQQFKEIHYKIT